MYHSKVAQVLKLYSSAKTLWCVRDKADTQDRSRTAIEKDNVNLPHGVTFNVESGKMVKS